MNVTVVEISFGKMSRDRHWMFLQSPYKATLVFDSDIIFVGSIEPLWTKLEESGVLVTRFYPPPYGFWGSPDRPGGRVAMMHRLRGLIETKSYETAIRRITIDAMDINIGVMGVSSPKGDSFVAEWARLIEFSNYQSKSFLVEPLAIALISEYPHYLADEIWNCPADEFYRKINLSDACIIHYFSEGSDYRGISIGRSRTTWAGIRWFDAYETAAKDLDLPKWVAKDPLFLRTQN